jgi:hypothetical protein
LWSGLLTHELVWSKVTVIFSTSNTAVACTFIISVGSHFGSVWTSGILIILSFHQCALYTGQCTASSHRLCRVLTGNHYSWRYSGHEDLQFVRMLCHRSHRLSTTCCPLGHLPLMVKLYRLLAVLPALPPFPALLLALPHFPLLA